MTDFFLGVDAGGTKTHAALVDDRGHILGIGRETTGNWEIVGMPEAGRALQSAVDQALNGAGVTATNCGSATFALAGIDWDSDRHALSSLVGSFGLGGPSVVMNDAMAALYAGTPDGIGVASVAGTGGKTVARDGKRERESLGMALGEGGGAGQIVAEGMRVLAESFHGQRPPTSLAPLVLSTLGQPDLNSLFQAVARDGLHLPESMAPGIFRLAEAGDEACADVVRSVAEQHARDVIGIVRGLDFPGAIPLVRAGGLHTAGSQLFDDAFNGVLERAELAVNASVLRVVPVVGAVLHAALRAGAPLLGDSRARLFDEALRLDEDFWTPLVG